MVNMSGSCAAKQVLLAFATFLLLVNATATTLAQPSEPFEVRFESDETITFLDPGDDNSDASFTMIPGENNEFTHIISIDGPLVYRDCTLTYRRSRSVRVRWQPPADFSELADDYYEVILAIIEPTEMQDTDVTVIFDTPEGFTSEHLDEYERLRSGEGLGSIRQFFITALLAQHFAQALPEGHGRTRRMVLASVDHLSEANRFLSSINLQPGFEYERFVVDNAGSGSRASTSISTLQGMNVFFFRDVYSAFRDITSGDPDNCRAGLETLRQLSACHDAISREAPDSLPDVMEVVTQNLEGTERGASSFDFTARVAEAEATCEALE